MDAIFGLLGGINPTQVPLGIIVAAGILFIFTGLLLPSRTVKKLLQAKDTIIDNLTDERDDWKQALSKSEEAREIQRNQVTELLDINKTTAHLLESLRERTGVIPPEDTRLTNE